MLDEGKGVPRDRAAAVKWFRRAAGQGHGPAQTRLGLVRQKQLRGLVRGIERFR